MASSDDPDFEASVHEPLRHGPDPQANPLDLGLATQSQTLLSKLFEKLAWGSLALLIGYSLWSTCDTTISVGAGESLPHIALALLAFLGASFCMRGALGVGSQSAAIVWGLIAIAVAWHGLVTAGSIGRTNSKHAVFGFWQSTAFLSLLGTLMGLLRSPRDSTRILKLWMVAATFLLLFGLWEYGVLQPKFREELARDRIGLLERQGIEPGSSAAVLIVNRIESTEVRSVFALANSYAGFLVALWPVLLGWTWFSFRRRAQVFDAGKPKGSLCTIVVPSILLATTGLSMLLTKSRTAWVAAAIATGLVFILDPGFRGDLWAWGKRRPAILFGLVIVILAIFGGVYALDPLIFQEAGKSLAYRMDYWQGALDLIAQEPWVGYGSLNFQSGYLRVKKMTAAETPADPHNFILEIAHAGGWVLFGLFLVLIVAIAAIGWWFGLFKKSIPFARHALEAELADAPGRTRWIDWISWAALVVVGLVVFAFAFFATGDYDLIGTAMALVGAIALAIWMNLDVQARTSAQLFVQEHPVVFLIAFFGTLIHFLASGGWMLPGTMIGPVLGLGIWLAGCLQRNPVPSATTGATTVRSRAWIGIATALGLIGLWGWSMALPWARSNAIEQRLVASTSLPKSDEFGEWIASAPLDPDLARFGLDYCATALERVKNEAELEGWLHQFQNARVAFLTRDPKHAMAYAELGKQTLRVGVSQTANPVLSQNTVVPGGARGGGGRNRGGSQPGQAGAAPAVQVPMVGRRMLQEAKQYYGEATKLNPASAELHLQAAVVAAMIGDWKMVQEMVDRASEIDGATRHLDRKIDAAKIWVPRAMVPVIESQAKRGGRLNEEENEDWKGFKQLNDRNESVPGEPVYRLLRSLLKRS